MSSLFGLGIGGAQALVITTARNTGDRSPRQSHLNKAMSHLRQDALIPAEAETSPQMRLQGMQSLALLIVGSCTPGLPDLLEVRDPVANLDNLLRIELQHNVT